MTVTPREDNGRMSNRVTPAVSGRRVFDTASDYHQRLFASFGRRNAAKFGLTEEQFWALVKGQNYACAICSTRLHAGGPKMAIDHNHTTGEVRGVLCSICNYALGCFQDSPDRLRGALRYLTERGCYGEDSQTGA